MILQSRNMSISSSIMRPSSRETRRCFAAKGKLDSSISKSCSSPAIQAGTRLEPTESRPASPKSRGMRKRSLFSGPPSCPMFGSDTQTHARTRVDGVAFRSHDRGGGGEGWSTAEIRVLLSDQSPFFSQRINSRSKT